MLLLALAGCTQFTGMTADPLVTVSTGQLRGARAEGVLVFRGIPYAAPPTGALRWRPPQPPVAWTGIRSALDYGSMCAQPRSAMLWFELINPSEDCLTLNVQTPSTRHWSFQVIRLVITDCSMLSRHLNGCSEISAPSAATRRG